MVFMRLNTQLAWYSIKVNAIVRGVRAKGKKKNKGTIKKELRCGGERGHTDITKRWRIVCGDAGAAS